MAEQLIYDYRAAELSAQDRALCDFAVKLTLSPSAMHEADVVQLRQLGFSDPQITIATQVVAYFNYINRIAEGLGVQPEDWMDVPIDQWLARKGLFSRPA